MPNAPRCRYCGGPIPKTTVTHYPRLANPDTKVTSDMIVERLPRSKADCQKLTNHQVVSVFYEEDTQYNRERGLVGAVYKFSTWDGESYDSLYFCSGNHAKDFGKLMAREGHCTKSYLKAISK